MAIAIWFGSLSVYIAVYMKITNKGNVVFFCVYTQHYKIMSCLECSPRTDPKIGAFESLGYATLSHHLCHPLPPSVWSYK